MYLIMALYEILSNPPNSIVGLCTEMMVFVGLVWIAFLVGVIVGWMWKPKWVNLQGDKLASCVSKFLDSSSLPSSPSRPLTSPLKCFGSAPCLAPSKVWTPSCESCLSDSLVDKKPSAASIIEDEDCSMLQPKEEQSNIAHLVMEEDLQHLCQLVKMKDGGPNWIKMMDRSTAGMTYQAWRRDPKTGPPQYRSRTVFENASPEMVRDFFWDDEFRVKWDDMLAYSATIDDCLTTGTIVVHWIRKFPFFCSDREYIIGRRIWKSGRCYYCVTKGVPYPSVQRHDKPRRVDLYYSSWYIQAVESGTSDGRLTACEVLLFHHEDMGIPWEIAKLGVRQGMWGAVKKLEPALRAYQKARASVIALSRPAFMAQINTEINQELLKLFEGTGDSSGTKAATTMDRPLGRNIPKLLIIGGAVILACSIDQGLLTKAFIFGVARKFGNIGRR